MIKDYSITRLLKKKNKAKEKKRETERKIEREESNTRSLLISQLLRCTFSADLIVYLFFRFPASLYLRFGGERK